MTEQIEKLRATLHELETEMAALAGPELDDQTRALLQETIDALQSAIAKQSPHLEPQSLAERLNASAQAFERSHPNLFSIVGRTIDALAGMGI